MLPRAIKDEERALSCHVSLVVTVLSVVVASSRQITNLLVLQEVGRAQVLM
jgi:hypothetical protein